MLLNLIHLSRSSLYVVYVYSIILLFIRFQSLALFGCLCGISSCLVIQFDTYFPVHIVAVLLGIAQAVLLITSLSAVAKLIKQDTFVLDSFFPLNLSILFGSAHYYRSFTSFHPWMKPESGAFVYGIFSSMDKISNGLALQVIELFSPSSCMLVR